MGEPMSMRLQEAARVDKMRIRKLILFNLSILQVIDFYQ